MLEVWYSGTPRKELLAGKRQRDDGTGQPSSQSEGGPVEHETITVATIRKGASVVTGHVGGKAIEIMMDSGSSVSLLRQDVLQGLQAAEKPHNRYQGLELVTASGDPIPILGSTQVPVKIGNLQVLHDFIIVSKLVTPAIAGTDFLHKHGLTLDFTQVPVTVQQPGQQQGETHKIWKEEQSRRIVTATVGVSEIDPVDECAIPQYGKPPKYDLPECHNSTLKALLGEYKELFQTTPGCTTKATHHITTTGEPSKVPPRRIPAHFKGEVKEQIRAMLQQGVIEESNSPWMAPAVFTRKESGEIRLCVDYRELNKKTKKDAYPLPLPDEVQDNLAGSTVFTTLDLQCGYWQVPVNPTDREKTAFCPGPGMGLFQFCRMPFGLAGAPSTFQRMMNQIFRDLPFVTVYIDDMLVHSTTLQEHVRHLQQVFQRLREAGLTLRGRKCHIAMNEVRYLGHIFSGAGMAPDPKKIQSIEDWPKPSSETEVRRFLGLASYYRRYIQRFADIAKPLTNLMQKGVDFEWTEDCDTAFNALKSRLMKAPILTYPSFEQGAAPFILQTDASAVGLGAVLEQGGHVIAYASRALNKAEQQYSVIQRECLAVVYATKQFRHYLLGRTFQLETDHAPLQWLSAQKMEGLLCRWALALQEYSFVIKYRKGQLNSNADALSRREGRTVSAATQVSLEGFKADVRRAQQEDDTIRTVTEALQKGEEDQKEVEAPGVNFPYVDTVSYGLNLRLWKESSVAHTIQVLRAKSSQSRFYLRGCAEPRWFGIMMHQGQDTKAWRRP